MRKAVNSLCLLTIIITMLGSLVLISCVTPFPLLSEEEINQLIEENGYRWRAGKTSISDLTWEEKNRLCGLKLDPPGNIEPIEEREIATELPASFDWRDYLRYDWTTPIRDQGQCGACTAFGILGAFESILKILDGSPDVNPDLSEEYLFFCRGGRCGPGLGRSHAAEFLLDNGVPDEDCWPYPILDEAHYPGCTMCPDPCVGCEPGEAFELDVTNGCFCANVENGAHHGGRVIKIDSWGYLPFCGFLPLYNREQIKYSIVHNGPVVAAMDVYEFFTYYESGCYRHVEHVNNTYRNSHVVTIVGWDDDIDCGDGCYGAWICKNSWGTDWGEDGWFKIAYGECGIDIWVLELTKDATDLYIRDNEEDRGDTPTSGIFWLSPDLIVRNENEDREPDVWINQDVKWEHDNWIYVKVHNIGENTVDDVEVHVYKSDFAGTQFIYPWDYKDEIFTSPRTISRLPAGGETVVKFKLLEEEIPSEDEMAHPCFLAEVRHTQDIDAGQWGICTGFSDTHVRENNNLAQRNIGIYQVTSGEFVEFEFNVGNAHSVQRPYSVLVVDRSQTPADAKIELDLRGIEPISLVGARLENGMIEIIPPSEIIPPRKGAEITIPWSQERRRVSLTFTVPADARLGEEYVVHIMEGDDNGKTVGGITLLVEVV